VLRFVLAFVNPRAAPTPTNLRSDDREHGSLAEGEARLELGRKMGGGPERRRPASALRGAAA